MSSIAELRAALMQVPDAHVPRSPAIVAGIEEAVRYLESDAALASIAADTYWPKWNSPWWQMLILWELGEARRIPARAVAAMVKGLNALPLHTFPIRPEDWPPNADRARDTSCHCALGSIDQVLSACGIDVDAELPWIAPWFPRYQMRDGGLNCDETAYLVEDECPSSMVGTVAPFEAMLRRAPHEFLDRGAAFLIERELRLGSSTRHNAEERDAQAAWLAPTFPRFYFYDVLRGLTALVRWAMQTRRAIPATAVAQVVAHLVEAYPDGIVRVERRAFAATGSWVLEADRVWRRHPVATTFPVLDATSILGAASPALTAEWRATRRGLVELIDGGLVS
jgi:hypothetical protein